MSNQAVTFDGQRIFGDGQQAVRAESWRRAQAERGFAGLDGVVSIDLGRRQRVLRRRGYLSAGSVAALQQRIEAINAYVDGQVHELVDQEGRSYAKVRMDSFAPTEAVTKQSQVRCRYEVVYTQLGE